MGTGRTHNSLKSTKGLNPPFAPDCMSLEKIVYVVAYNYIHAEYCARNILKIERKRFRYVYSPDNLRGLSKGVTLILYEDWATNKSPSFIEEIRCFAQRIKDTRRIDEKTILG